jgi:hypothetical protein
MEAIFFPYKMMQQRMRKYSFILLYNKHEPYDVQKLVDISNRSNSLIEEAYQGFDPLDLSSRVMIFLLHF